MAKPRPQKTLADYVAIAMGPVLIMLLVGSLCFFLLDIVYTGQHAGRMRWILFWFVLAAVLIERIAIEQGPQAANTYALVFWAAVALVVFRFVGDAALVALGLLAVAWWCARKLTYDCTVIDDQADASGQGLLQLTGLDDARDFRETAAPEADPQLETETSPGEALAKNSSSDRPHAPGTWVVYFSLAALPLFGLGQLRIPAEETARRSEAFRFLWIYVAAGVGLLLTTSFLGLRRYLRQRRLPMPATVTRSWLWSGVAIGLGVLFVTLLLPRPNSAMTLKETVDKVSETVGKASDWAFGSDDAGAGDGRNVGREAEDDEQANDGKQGQDGQGGSGSESSSTTSSGNDGKKKSGSGKQKSNGKQADSQQQKSREQQHSDGKQQSNQQDRQQNQSNSSSGQQRSDEKANEEDSAGNDGKNSADARPPEASRDQLSQVGSWVSKLVKWVLYGGLACVAVFLILKFWRTLLQGVVTFFKDLQEFFRNLWNLLTGRTADAKSRSRRLSTSNENAFPARPFHSFANPFATGQAQNMPIDELMRYTFAAVEAWGHDAGCPRRDDCTPAEYFSQLKLHASDWAACGPNFSRAYARVAYSSQAVAQDAVDATEAVWQLLSRMPARSRQVVDSPAG